MYHCRKLETHIIICKLMWAPMADANQEILAHLRSPSRIKFVPLSVKEYSTTLVASLPLLETASTAVHQPAKKNKHADESQHRDSQRCPPQQQPAMGAACSSPLTLPSPSLQGSPLTVAQKNCHTALTTLILEARATPSACCRAARRRRRSRLR